MSDDKTKKSIKKKITNTVKKAVKKVKGAPKRATWKLKKALANKQAINYETKSGKPLHLVRASLGYRNNTTAKNQKTEMLYRLAKMNLNNLNRGGLQNFRRKPKEKNMELTGYNYYNLSRYRDSHDKINTVSIPKKKRDALRKKLETKIKTREKELDKINVNAWVKAARNRANIEKRKVSAIKSINSLPTNMQEIIKKKYKEGEFKKINNILAKKNTNKLFIYGHPNASKKLKSLMFKEIQAKRPNLPNLPSNSNKKRKNSPKYMYNHTTAKTPFQRSIIKRNT